TNTIYVSDHGFVGTSIPVNYGLTSGATVGGLTSGSRYVLQVVDDGAFQLYDRATGLIVDLTAPTGAATLALGTTGANIGDLTVGDIAIDGLEDGEQYYVIKVDDDHIRLVADLADVGNAKALDLKSSGDADLNEFASSPLTNGIGVQATLSSDTRT